MSFVDPGQVARGIPLAAAVSGVARAARSASFDGPTEAAMNLSRGPGVGLLAGLLALGACGSPAATEETGEAEGSTSTTEPTTTGTSTGDGVNLCVDVVCGADATCDPHDGGCYCDPGFWGDGAAGCTAYPNFCADAEAVVGHSVCVHEIGDAATWQELSVPGVEEEGLRRMGKYLAPIDPSAPLPTLFGDRSEYNLHICMLQEGFPEVLPGFTQADYLALVYRRATRTMIAGSVYEIVRDDLEVRHVFTVEVPDEPNELLREEEVYAVYRLLQDRFTLAPLGYLPRSSAQQGFALGWDDPGMPVLFNAGVHEPVPLKCE